MSSLKVTTPDKTTLRFERFFSAPRERVFDVFHDPEMMKNWYSSPDYPVIEVVSEPKVGGDLKLVWSQPDGGQMVLRGQWLEMDRPNSSKFSEKWDEDWTGGEVINDVAFLEKDGGTLLILTSTYSSKEARDGAAAMGATEGFGSSLDTLETLL
ncbi:MAG: SRPBCC domain-containing protein [Pseudomonadota bacterium]